LSIEVLLVQLLVLAFTGALWWIARRDLASRVSPPVMPVEPADTAELEQLCATLESLVTSLARRLERVEQQARMPIPAPVQSLESAALEPAEISPAERSQVGEISPVGRESLNLMPSVSEPPAYSEPAPDPRFAPVYAMLDAGVFDPVEIARQTGLGRGEVDLILSLRDRRAF
jgi:hypothetical protein